MCDSAVISCVPRIFVLLLQIADGLSWLEVTQPYITFKQLCRLLAFPATGLVSSGGEIVRAVLKIQILTEHISDGRASSGAALGGQTSEQYAWARRRRRLITRPHREEDYTRPDEY